MSNYDAIKSAALAVIETEQGSPSHFLKCQQLMTLVTAEGLLEMIAHIKRQASQFKEWQASHHANYCAAAAERDELRAENGLLQKDAARYRWLRDNSMRATTLGVTDVCLNDRAIDAAMVQEARP